MLISRIFWSISRRFLGWTDCNLIASGLFIFLLFIDKLILYILKNQNIYWKEFLSIYYFITLWLTTSCTIIYWTIYYINFDLIKNPNIIISFYEHHIGHTLPSLLILLIGIIKLFQPIYIIKSYFYSYWNINQLSQIGLLSCYLININLNYYKFHYWPYPFMNNLNLFQWIIYSITAYLLSITVFHYWINKYFRYLTLQLNPAAAAVLVNKQN